MKSKIKTITFIISYPLFLIYYRLKKKEFPNVINSQKTLELLIDKRKSISRFGDGEFRIISGGEIGFQHQNTDLTKALKRVLESSDERCLIGIPDVFDGFSRFRKDARRFWLYTVVKNWNKWKPFLHKGQYADSLCSRFYMDLSQKTDSLKILSLWKQLWKKRNIVIIEGKHTKMGIGNDLFKSCKSIRRIICPSKDAFKKYKSIYTEALKLDVDDLILIALGPTASVLAYDLAIKGFQAIDTGHLDLEYNWLCNNSQNKEPVAGRWINEINNSSVIEIKDEEYDSQIIVDLS